MANPLTTFFKKADKALTAFAQSKAALPVLAGAMGVVVVAGAVVYVTSGGGNSASSALSASSTEIEYTVSDDTEEELYVSATIDTELYVDTVLHESEDAGDEYIDDTLFLGDSNTYRYMSYGFADLTNAVGVVGMSVGGIESLGCVKFQSYSDYVTIPEALPIMQPERVVFGFGTNNLGGSVDSYIETYTAAIQACYDAYPYFDVIVCAVPPIDQYTSYSVTMNQINTFNAALVVMCEENGWKFLNTSEVLINPDTGYAYTSYTVSDGLHLSLDGCTALFEYIRTHAYETEDIRPKPLAEILERDETPPDLITVDPLKTTGSSTSSTTTVSTVDVYFAAATGGSISGTVDQSIALGSSTSSVTAVADAGYYFVGWNCSYAGVSDAYSTSITYTAPSDINAFGGVVVTAYFAKDSYDVTFTLAGDGVAGASLSKTSATVSYGETASATLTLQSGYTAEVKNGSLSGTTVTSSSVSKDLNVTITVTAPVVTETPDTDTNTDDTGDTEDTTQTVNYNVSFALSGATDGTTAPATQSVTSGESTTVTVSVATGYEITGVSGTGAWFSGNTVTVSNVTADTSVTITIGAVAVTPTYTVTFALSDGAGGSLSATSASVTSGDSTSVTVSVADGYQITGVDNGTWEGTTVTVSNVTTDTWVTVYVGATTTYYTVNFNLSGDTGGASLSSTGGQVESGGSTNTNVNLPDGYTISGADSGATVSGNNVSISGVSGDVTVTITLKAPESTDGQGDGT